MKATNESKSRNVCPAVVRFLLCQVGSRVGMVLFTSRAAGFWFSQLVFLLMPHSSTRKAPNSSSFYLPLERLSSSYHTRCSWFEVELAVGLFRIWRIVCKNRKCSSAVCDACCSCYTTAALSFHKILLIFYFSKNPVLRYGSLNEWSFTSSWLHLKGYHRWMSLVAVSVLLSMKTSQAVTEVDLLVLPIDTAQLSAPVDPHRQIASPTLSSLNQSR